MIEFTCKIRVRYAETDKMGVVYHGNYFIWFEAARVQMLDALGMPYATIEEAGFRLPVIECSAKFYHPAHFDDRLHIHLIIPAPPRLRLKVAYRVMRDETHLAEGSTEHVFINTKGQPTKPPPNFIAMVHKHY